MYGYCFQHGEYNLLDPYTMTCAKHLREWEASLTRTRAQIEG